MDINPNKLVLKTVFFLGLLVVLSSLDLLILFLLLNSMFPFHHLVVTIGCKVQMCRELKMLVDLVILESIEVEQDPLQMHNQYVGCLSD